jgi:hypothetical protein
MDLKSVSRNRSEDTWLGFKTSELFKAAFGFTSAALLGALAIEFDVIGNRDGQPMPSRKSVDNSLVLSTNLLALEGLIEGADFTAAVNETRMVAIDECSASVRESLKRVFGKKTENYPAEAKILLYNLENFEKSSRGQNRGLPPWKSADSLREAIRNFQRP